MKKPYVRVTQKLWVLKIWHFDKDEFRITCFTERGNKHPMTEEEFMRDIAKPRLAQEPNGTYCWDLKTRRK